MNSNNLTPSAPEPDWENDSFSSFTDGIDLNTKSKLLIQEIEKWETAIDLAKEKPSVIAKEQSQELKDLAQLVKSVWMSDVEA